MGEVFQVKQVRAVIADSIPELIRNTVGIDWQHMHFDALIVVTDHSKPLFHMKISEPLDINKKKKVREKCISPGVPAKEVITDSRKRSLDQTTCLSSPKRPNLEGSATAIKAHSTPIGSTSDCSTLETNSSMSSPQPACNKASPAATNNSATQTISKQSQKNGAQSSCNAEILRTDNSRGDCRSDRPRLTREEKRIHANANVVELPHNNKGPRYLISGVEFSKGIRDRWMAFFENYTYNQSYSNPLSTRWTCYNHTRKGCPVKLRTINLPRFGKRGPGSIYDVRGEHNHAPRVKQANDITVPNETQSNLKSAHVLPACSRDVSYASHELAADSHELAADSHELSDMLESIHDSTLSNYINEQSFNDLPPLLDPVMPLNTELNTQPSALSNDSQKVDCLSLSTETKQPTTTADVRNSVALDGDTTKQKKKHLGKYDQKIAALQKDAEDMTLQVNAMTTSCIPLSHTSLHNGLVTEEKIIQAPVIEPQASSILIGPELKAEMQRPPFANDPFSDCSASTPSSGVPESDDEDDLKLHLSDGNIEEARLDNDVMVLNVEEKEVDSSFTVDEPQVLSGHDVSSSGINAAEQSSAARSISPGNIFDKVVPNSDVISTETFTKGSPEPDLKESKQSVKREAKRRKVPRTGTRRLPARRTGRRNNNDYVYDDLDTCSENSELPYESDTVAKLLDQYSKPLSVFVDVVREPEEDRYQNDLNPILNSEMINRSVFTVLQPPEDF